MSTTTNYPSATPQSQPPKKDYKNLVIGLLAAGFLGTWGYLLWNNNRNASNQFGSHWTGPFDQADAGRQSSALDGLNAAIAVSA